MPDSKCTIPSLLQRRHTLTFWPIAWTKSSRATAFLATLGAIASMASPSAHAGQKHPLYDLHTQWLPASSQDSKIVAFQVRIQAKDGRVLKKQTPFDMRLTASKGVQLAQDTFSNQDFIDADAQDKTIKTAVTIEASAQSTAKIHGTASFFLCNESLCQRFNATFQSP